jgi:hypothetical protein
MLACSKKLLLTSRYRYILRATALPSATNKQINKLTRSRHYSTTRQRRVTRIETEKDILSSTKSVSQLTTTSLDAAAGGGSGGRGGRVIIAGISAIGGLAVAVTKLVFDEKRAAAAERKAADVEYDSAHKRIRECNTMEDFIREYESSFYQQCMENLRIAIGTLDKETWAKDWAIRMRTEPVPHRDFALNKDRKVCLLLLYSLCTR